MLNYKEDMSLYFSRIRVLLACLLLSQLSSCMSSRLAVYTDYLSHENLASYFIETPDPFLNNPTIGQRLIITWTLKKRHLLYQDLHLDISIRFRDKQEITLKHPITRPQGTYVYALLNQDYIDHDGILTYKVELVGDGQILDEWRHQIWTNLILVGHNTTEAEKAMREEKRNNENQGSDDLESEIDFGSAFDPLDI